jgi:para-nitrobenzyl esterase
MEQSEDCLHLSVWTPGLDSARRPVLVWIHGGGFVTGTAGNVMYAGGDLAQRSDVVAVTVNYRLGGLGFLAHPLLATAEHAGYGNWGLLDQIAALRWVRDHIAAFGGDPSNVTVFGESAGGMSVSALLAMPSARGLFHKAIVESGPPYTHGANRAAEAAEDVVKELGLGEVSRDLLQRVPATDLVAAVGAVQARPPRSGELPLPLLPVVDGVTLPVDPLEAVARGSAEEVPLVVGTNKDELAFFALADPGMATIDDAQLLGRVRRSAPAARPEEVVATYRRARMRRGEPVTPRDLWVAAGSDLVFRWPSLRLAAAQRARQPRTFVYLFTWETPVFGGIFGACHALEIPFVFGTVRHPVVGAFSGGGAAAEALSEDMQAAWAAFARTGDPSSRRSGPWPAWDPARRATMVFGRRATLEEAPRDEELAVWKPLAPLADPPLAS